MTENGSLRADVQELLVEVAVLKARLQEKDNALRLQAVEYERRLEDLNHAHRDAKDVLAKYGSTYLTIDRFDRFINDEHIPWRRKVDDVLSSERSNKAVYTSIIAVLFALASIGIQAWDVLIKH